MSVPFGLTAPSDADVSASFSRGVKGQHLDTLIDVRADRPPASAQVLACLFSVSSFF